MRGLQPAQSEFPFGLHTTGPLAAASSLPTILFEITQAGVLGALYTGGTDRNNPEERESMSKIPAVLALPPALALRAVLNLPAALKKPAVAAALLLSWAPHSSFAAEACDRACLSGIMDQYLGAMVAHDPAKAPAALNIKYTENAADLDFSAALRFEVGIADRHIAQRRRGAGGIRHD